MPPSRVSRVALALLLLGSGCTAWVQRAGEPGQVLRDERHTWIVIGTVEGEEMVLHWPLVGEGQLTGRLVDRVGVSGDPSDAVTIPLERVAWVGTRRGDRLGRSRMIITILTVSGTVMFPFIAESLGIW